MQRVTMSKTHLARKCRAWQYLDPDPVGEAARFGTRGHKAIEQYLMTGELPVDDDVVRDIVMSSCEFIDDANVQVLHVEQSMYIDPHMFEAGLLPCRDRAYPEVDTRLYGTADLIGRSRTTGRLIVADWKLGNLHDESHRAQVKLMAQTVHFIFGEPVDWVVVTLGRVGYAVACQGVAQSCPDWDTVTDMLTPYPIPMGGTHCGMCPSRRSCVRDHGQSDVRSHDAPVKFRETEFAGVIGSRSQFNALLTLGRAMPEVCTVRLSKTKLRRHFGEKAPAIYDAIGRGMIGAIGPTPQGGINNE